MVNEGIKHELWTLEIYEKVVEHLKNLWIDSLSRECNSLDIDYLDPLIFTGSLGKAKVLGRSLTENEKVL